MSKWLYARCFLYGLETNTMRRWWWFGFLCVLWVADARPVFAQTNSQISTSFVLQRFRPSSDPDGLFNTYGGESLGQGRFFVGLWADFGYQPLVINGGREGRRSLVDWQLGGNLDLGIGILDMKWLGIDVFLDAPWSFYMAGGFPNTISCGGNSGIDCQVNRLDTAALGDFSLSVRWRILAEKWQGVGLSLLIGVQLPTGDTSAFSGEGEATVQAFLAASKTFDFIRLAGNLGVRSRPERTFLDLTTTTELIFQGGVGLIPSKDKFEILLEAKAGIALGAFSASNVPLELIGGMKFYPLSEPTLAIYLGGAWGAFLGYGIPAFRAFLGITFTRKAILPSDRDRDGIIDKDDSCPDQPGPRSNRGCPADRDRDGIIDRLDKCPDRPGPRSNRGCPYGDIDGDGILDNEDNCVNTPGPLDNNGCPWGDKDGDGMKDNVDQCPDRAGSKENHGCPDLDRDKDTVVDRKDNCPDIPGPVSNKGCPLKIFVKVNKKTGKILLLKKVYFATARAKIRKKSYPVLDQVVAVMNSNPKIRVRIEGHTDDRGSARYNKNLSQRRTDSVKRYLEGKGVAENRLVAKGFGEEKPIASNKTRKGRAENRRVEFHIID